MTETPPAGRSWNPLRRVSGLYADFRDKLQKRQAARFLSAVLTVVRQLPEGRDMLRFAAENDVLIQVVPQAQMPQGVAAHFFRTGAGPFAIALGMDGAGSLNAGFTALSLLHELRHARQQKEWLPYGNVADFLAVKPREAYLDLVAMEADAFVYQTVIGLRLGKAGSPEHLQNFLGSDNRETGTIRRFLSAHPAVSFPDEKTFARALFTELATRGLHEYRAHYMHFLSSNFKALELPEQAAARMAEAAEVTEVKPSRALGALYGEDFIDALSLRALRAAVERALPREESAALRRMDGALEEARRADKAQAREGYKTRREKILKAAGDSLRLQESFAQASHGSPAAAAGRALSRLARLQKPATMSAFNAAARAEKNNAAMPALLVFRPAPLGGGKIRKY